MRIYRIKENEKHYFKPSAGCIGYFDGVHRGHQKLIEKALQLSEEKDLESCVITFEPDPSEIYGNESDRRHLLTDDMKYEMFRNRGISRVYVISFDENTSRMSPESFIEFLNSLNIRELVCGFDFSFGYKGKGNTGTLRNSKKRDFSITVIDPVTYNDRKISSRDISDLIINGKMKEAEMMLGYPYMIRIDLRGGSSVMQYVPADGTYNGHVFNSECIVEIRNGMISIPGILEMGVYIGKDNSRRFVTVIFDDYIII